ncbi:peptidase S10 [Sphingomonas sp. BT-65]|uniref:S10 family peptidase n=1 Tax=Sphingomonas sp. BT-65 TaxID=2989821 RepID=UPI002235FA87|nr:peptidase S10 [Sphingomonas sp. BT-65]MCW4460899.1 peptidase S10 [Sphingomonas sp. BT-65]
MRNLVLTGALLAGAASLLPAAAPGAAAQAVPAPRDAADDALPSAVEAQAVTTHRIAIGGKTLAYKAIAGTLTLRDDAGKPKASMFYVAYVRDPLDPRRPLTFFYNGGPGSSSLWLHMASFGPRRVMLNTPNPAAGAPSRLVDNEATLLPESDLVFLDAIHTGFSRPLGESGADAFLSADADIDIFTRGIERFLTVQNRWNAPVYLLGESYGTSRSAGVANLLQKHGVQLSGVIQLGTILDIARELTHGDRSFMTAVPTLAATAAYHGVTHPPGDRDAYLREVAAWVEGPYSQALAKGNTIGDDEKQAIARQLAAYIGLDPAFVLRENLRISHAAFRRELLRPSGKIVGEIDTRFSAAVGTAGNDASLDPSWTGIFRPMVSLWNDYVRNELKFDTGPSYRRAYSGAFEKFDFRRGNGAGWGNYGKDLAEAMIENPKLKILSINGLYDLSTVYYGADYDYRHLAIPPALRGNIAYLYYPSGHMLYIDDQVRRDMVRDIRPFYAQ